MSGFHETPETVAILKMVMARVQARINRGEGPPTRSIPREKAAFPKVLCLDQNKWIDLGRAHYQRDGGEAFVEALGAIRAAVGNGRLMVPIMSSNLIEVSEPNDEGRRQRTAQLMVDLSGNHSFSKPEPVADLQMHRAICALYLGEQLEPFPREKLVAWGVDNALGMRWRGTPLLVQTNAEPELSVLALVNAMDRDSITEGRELDERAAVAARAARAGGDRPERITEELTNLFNGGSFADRLYRVVDNIGIESAKFTTWLNDNMRRFAAAIPDVDVHMRLLLARDRNPQHKTHRNDLKDFMFLRVAVPYANIVVTENSWTHLIRSEKIDQQYETTVIADLRELPELLRREGCLG